MTAKLIAYTSIFDAPLDTYDVPDVGDVGLSKAILTPKQKRAAKKQPTLVVPFTRTIALGSVGLDVVGAKRAIWRGTGLAVPHPTRVFGPIAVKRLRQFQSEHHLAADGQLGPATLAMLAPYFDAYAFLLYAGYPPGGSKIERIRNAIVAYAIWGYNNRVEIHYDEFRPMTFMTDLEHLPVTEDCSTFATKAYKFSGAPDPNGLDYDGAGNTETMRVHGWDVSIAAALPADLVQYDDPEHVAVYIGRRRVISLGSEPGPNLLPYDYRPVREIRSYLPVS